MNGERAAPPSSSPIGSVIEVPDARRDQEVAALFEHHYQPLCRLAYVILGDRSVAEEIVMEAVLRTFAGWTRVRDVDSSGAYLRRAVVNLCRSRIRRAALESRVGALIHRREQTRAARSEEDRRVASMAIWDAVRALPERQRACVVLRYYEDLPATEIADIMDCSVGTVKSQLAKARRKLEEVLRPLRVRGDL
jgi:RNA polymerase sigma-70 factor (sigma-E family)